jgi:hypothetical protein
MLKFFRRIRQNILNEGKTSRYFKYAIGEIILVVAGILIALQINNWNEERKERIQEIALLKQLRVEFKSNLEQLDEKVSIRREIIHAASNLLNFIDNPNARNKDSINYSIATSIAYTTFDPVVSDMSNSGSIRLIKNDSLKQLLSFWTSEIVQVTEVEAGWRKYRDEVYVPFLIEHYQLRTARTALIKTDYLKKFQIDKNIDSYLLTIGGIGNTKYPEDYNHILDLPDFEDHLVRCIVTNNIGDVQSAILRKRIIQILEIIESEIPQ